MICILHMNPILENRLRFANEHKKELKRQALDKLESTKTNITWALQRLDDSPYFPLIDYHFVMYTKYGDEYIKQIGLSKTKTKQLMNEIKSFQNYKDVLAGKAQVKKVAPKPQVKPTPNKQCKACMMKGPGRRPAHTCGIVQEKPVKTTKTAKTAKTAKTIKKPKAPSINASALAKVNKKKVIKLQALVKGRKARKAFSDMQPEKRKIISAKSLEAVNKNAVMGYKGFDYTLLVPAIQRWAHDKFGNGKFCSLTGQSYPVKLQNNVKIEAKPVTTENMKSQTWKFEKTFKEHIHNIANTEDKLFALERQKSTVKCRYYFIWLGLSFGVRENKGSRIVHQKRHANLLVIDKKDKNITRYEPHGIPRAYNTKSLDNEIERTFKKSALKDYTYISPTALGISDGPQARAQWAKLKATSTFGKCMMWNFAYIYARLKYPGWTPKQIARLFVKDNQVLYNYEEQFITMVKKYVDVHGKAIIA